VLPEDFVDRDAAGDVLFEGDEVLPVELPDVHPAAPGEGMIRRADQDEAVRGQRDDLQPPAWLRVGNDAEIDAPARQSS